MELTVRYAKRDELERVNELRRAVSELHANGTSRHFPSRLRGRSQRTGIQCLRRGGHGRYRRRVRRHGLRLCPRTSDRQTGVAVHVRPQNLPHRGIRSRFRLQAARRGKRADRLLPQRSRAHGLRAHLARRLVLQRIRLEILRIPRIPHVPKLHGSGRVISPADRQVGGIGAERTPTVRSALLLCLPRGTSDGGTYAVRSLPPSTNLSRAGASH